MTGNLAAVAMTRNEYQKKRELATFDAKSSSRERKDKAVASVIIQQIVSCYI